MTIHNSCHLPIAGNLQNLTAENMHFQIAVDTPAGQNSTGQSDLENYYNYVERYQKLLLKGNLNTLINLIVRVGLRNGNLTEEPDIKLTFNPLWSMSDSEKADVDQKKAQTQLIRAQTAQIYIDSGALDPTEVRRGLAQDEEFQIEELLNSEPDIAQDPWGAGPDIPQQQEAEKKPSDNQQNPLTAGESSGRVNDDNSTVDGGPGSGRYPKGSGEQQYSATGENKIPPMTESAKKRHKKHLKSFGNISIDEYAQRGGELASKPVGGSIKGYRAANGAIVRYDVSTGEFAKGFSTGLATYFKPSRGEAYYNDQLVKDGGTTDD